MGPSQEAQWGKCHTHWAIGCSGVAGGLGTTLGDLRFHSPTEGDQCLLGRSQGLSWFGDGISGGEKAAGRDLHGSAWGQIRYATAAGSGELGFPAPTRWCLGSASSQRALIYPQLTAAAIPVCIPPARLGVWAVWGGEQGSALSKAPSDFIAGVQ